MALPILNASSLNNGTEKEREEFGKALLSALTRDGAVKVVNTRITDGEVAQAFDTCKTFFHLPVQQKIKIANDPKQAQQRGWSVAGEEKTWYLEAVKNGGTAPKFNDARESIDIGSNKDIQFPNKWLPDSVQPKHRQIMEAFFEQCAELSLQLLRSLAVASGLPPSAYTERCSNDASTMRANNYPAVDVRLLDAGEIGRAWQHKDFGIISLVFPGVVGGLEYEDRENPGQFLPVGFTSQSDIVILVAETFQRWTNDRVQAGLHRVQKPTAEEIEGYMAPERTSMVFFCKADRHASVGPLQCFVSSEGSPYEDITALEYQDQRNKAHYPAY